METTVKGLFGLTNKPTPGSISKMFDTPPNSYESELIEIMWYEEVSLKEALFIDMWGHEVNLHSVYDVVDYLESKLVDLDKVQYYMQVYTGQLPDVGLKPLDDKEN